MRPSYQSVFLSAVAAALFAVLGLGAAGCGGDSEPTGAAGTTTKKNVSPSGLSSSYDDDVMEKALKAVGATKVDFDGKTLRAHFEGSAEDAVAWTKCSAMQVVGSKAKTHIIVYTDGELDCAKRYDD